MLTQEVIRFISYNLFYFIVFFVKIILINETLYFIIRIL